MQQRIHGGTWVQHAPREVIAEKRAAAMAHPIAFRDDDDGRWVEFKITTCVQLYINGQQKAQNVRSLTIRSSDQELGVEGEDTELEWVTFPEGNEIADQIKEFADLVEKMAKHHDLLKTTYEKILDSHDGSRSGNARSSTMSVATQNARVTVRVWDKYIRRLTKDAMQYEMKLQLLSGRVYWAMGADDDGAKGVEAQPRGNADGKAQHQGNDKHEGIADQLFDKAVATTRDLGVCNEATSTEIFNEAKAFHSDLLFMASNRHPLFAILFAHPLNDLTFQDSVLLEAAVVVWMLFNACPFSYFYAPALTEEIQTKLGPIVVAVVDHVDNMIVEVPTSMIMFELLRLSLRCPILRKSIGWVEPAYICRGFQYVMRFGLCAFFLFAIYRTYELLPFLLLNISRIAVSRLTAYSIWFPKQGAMLLREWRKQRELRREPRDPPEQSGMAVFLKVVILSTALIAYGLCVIWVKRILRSKGILGISSLPRYQSALIMQSAHVTIFLAQRH